MSRADAESQAANMTQGKIGLHAPDQVVAGKYSQLLAMGPGPVNYSIGGGWPSRIGDLDVYAKSAKAAGQKKMNGKVCVQEDGTQLC